MKLSLKSVARFTRQLATYEDSFVDVRRALDSLASNSADGRLASSVRRVRDRINGGMSLFEAFGAEGNRYPVIFLRMTRIGEESGSLALIYRNLADYFDQQVSMRRRFIQRLLYPAFMLGVMVLVHSILTAVFASMGETALNWHQLERVFIKTFFTDIAIIGLVVGGVFLARFLLVGRGLTDALVTYVPPLRGAFRKLALARFTLSMYLMTGSAVGMPDAVRESAAATGNAIFSWKLDKAARRLEEGMALTPVLADTGLFPQEFIDISEVAEESGTVSESMRRVSAHYAEDADIAMNRLVSTLAGAIYLGMIVAMAFYIIKLASGYARMIWDFSTF